MSAERAFEVFQFRNDSHKYLNRITFAIESHSLGIFRAKQRTFPTTQFEWHTRSLDTAQFRRSPPSTIWLLISLGTLFLFYSRFDVSSHVHTIRSRDAFFASSYNKNKYQNELANPNWPISIRRASIKRSSVILFCVAISNEKAFFTQTTPLPLRILFGWRVCLDLVTKSYLIRASTH